MSVPVGRRYEWVAVVFLSFVLVYSCSLSLVYVEGDDATTVAYHVLGRNSEIQGPYATYHSMLDATWSFLPATEAVLRPTLILTTSLAAILVAILLLALAFDWIGVNKPSERTAVTAVLLLAAPEFFYLGLIYTPTIIAMAFLLMAHLVLRRSVRKAFQSGRNSVLWRGTALSVLLFGFGAACRWDAVVYGGVIFADLVVGPRWVAPGFEGRFRWSFGVAWGAVALGSWLGCMAVSGYPPNELFGMGQFAAKWAPSVSALTAPRIHTLFGPAFLLLALFGAARLDAPRRGLLIVAVTGVAVVGMWIPGGVPKQLLPGLPPLLACAVLGMRSVWEMGRPAGPIVRAAVVVLLVAPWFVGVQMTRADSAWGPGFEMRPYDRPYPTPESVSVGPFVGAAFPTPEGPRPLMGHAFALLGGHWRRFVQTAALERRAAVQYAATSGLPLLWAFGRGFAFGGLAREKFALDGAPGNRDELFEIQRVFPHSDGTSVELALLNDRAAAFDADRVDRIARALGDSPVVLSGYSSTLRRLHLAAPEALQSLGISTAIVDLTKLAAGLRAAGEQRNH